MSTDTDEVVTAPLTEQGWDDLVAVFGTRGDPSWCWCQFFLTTGKDHTRSSAANKATGRGADSSWTLGWGLLAGVALVLVLSLAQGVGFGLALLNTPAAIVAYLVLPTAWSFVTALVRPMRTAGEWLDLGNATTPLLEGAAMHAKDWAQVGTASALWVVVPLAIGLWRVTRSEVK